MTFCQSIEFQGPETVITIPGSVNRIQTTVWMCYTSGPSSSVKSTPGSTYLTGAKHLILVPSSVRTISFAQCDTKVKKDRSFKDLY